MRLNSLTARGMLLVCVPLIAQIIFVVLLMKSWTDITTELARESRSTEVISDCETASRETIEFLYKIKMDMDENATISIPYSNMIAGLKNRYRNLSLIDTSDSNVRALLKKAEALFDSGVVTLNEWRNESTMAHPDLDKMNRLSLTLANTTYYLVDTLKQAENLESASTINLPLKSQELRRTIKLYLVMAVSLSIVSAIVLTIFFVKSIRKPLERISENTTRLSERKPLLEPHAGNDELSELDRLIQKVSGAVSDALVRERELVENAADMICSTDADLIITSINPYAGKMLGVEYTTIIGKPIFHFVVDEDIARVDQEFNDLKDSDRKIADFDLQLKGAEGQVVDSSWSASWSGMHKSFFCVVKDVTERKNLERVKQNFVDMISHDLRSPLMSVYFSMLLIAEGLKGPVSPAVRQRIIESSKSLEQMSLLINDLLDFQKFRAGKMQMSLVDFDMKDAIQDSLNMVNSIAENKDVKIFLPEGNWNLRGDKDKLKQVIINLLSNAIKFSPQSGEVLVDVIACSDFIELTVTDFGPGIPEEYQEKIFEAFEQVPGSPKAKDGSGLGLAICKLIVEGHEGTIGVRRLEHCESNQTGSVFWFKMPRV